MGMLSRFVAGAGEGLADVGKQMLRTADSGLLIEQQAKIQQERDFRLEEYKTGEREAGERFLSKEKGLDRADQAPLRSAQARLYGSQAGEAEQKTVDRKRLSELQDQFLALSPEQRAGDEG